MIPQPTRSSERMNKAFVVVSGLPGSGKSTLANHLSPLLNLPVIDKDDILERLFRAKGVGDLAWRRALSRESDELLRTEALNRDGALLVSFWHLLGMAPDSGTPTEWLGELSNRLFNVNCSCSPEIAAERFSQRNRHAGHLDNATSKEEVLASIQAISLLGSLKVGHRIEVDTSHGLPELHALVGQIFDYLPSLKTRSA
jgi:energy-coupling factor transporter ATP-binding protein EcfA2